MEYLEVCQKLNWWWAQFSKDCIQRTSFFVTNANSNEWLWPQSYEHTKLFLWSHSHLMCALDKIRLIIETYELTQSTYFFQCEAQTVVSWSYVNKINFDVEWLNLRRSFIQSISIPFIIFTFLAIDILIELI